MFVWQLITARSRRRNLGKGLESKAMSRINQELLDRLASKLRVTNARIYQLIAGKASATGHDRDVAALLVASEYGVNYHKYSTPTQRAIIRGSLNSSATRNIPADATAVGQAVLT